MGEVGGLIEKKQKYSRTSMVRTLMARLPCLTRTRSWVPMNPYMRLLHLCFHAVIFIF